MKLNPEEMLYKDLFSKPCPSGLPHSVVGRIVTNKFGHKFCLHSNCTHANMNEIYQYEATPLQ